MIIIINWLLQYMTDAVCCSIQHLFCSMFYNAREHSQTSPCWTPSQRRSPNGLRPPNEIKVVRVMSPRTSRPIMAWLTFTQPLKAWELWCLPLCVSVSASRCLSQRCNSMSNRVSAHTTGLRERRDKAASPLHLSPWLFIPFFFSFSIQQQKNPQLRFF